MHVSAWRVDCGFVRPGPGGWSWLSDAHVAAALLVAVPVWLVLGAIVGDRMRAPIGWSTWLSFVLLQPLIEEFAFRGVLQGLLLRRSRGRVAGPISLANLGTTVAFVTLHLMAQPPPWALAVAVPSLVFGHLRERFGSVLPAVFVHIVYNAGFGMTAWWVQR